MAFLLLPRLLLLRLPLVSLLLPPVLLLPLPLLQSPALGMHQPLARSHAPPLPRPSPAGRSGRAPLPRLPACCLRRCAGAAATAAPAPRAATTRAHHRPAAGGDTAACGCAGCARRPLPSTNHRRTPIGAAARVACVAHPAVGADGVEVEEAARGQQLQHMQRLGGQLQGRTRGGRRHNVAQRGCRCERTPSSQHALQQAAEAQSSARTHPQHQQQLAVQVQALAACQLDIVPPQRVAVQQGTAVQVDLTSGDSGRVGESCLDAPAACDACSHAVVPHVCRPPPLAGACPPIRSPGAEWCSRRTAAAQRRRRHLQQAATRAPRCRQAGSGRGQLRG